MTAIDDAFHRAMDRAEAAGLTAEGHSAMIEAMRQIGDRQVGMDAKLDILVARSGNGSLATLAKWGAAFGTIGAGIWAGWTGKSLTP